MLFSPLDVIYAIRLYNTDMDEEVWVEEAAHHAVIFDLKWTKNDRYLISTAGDGTCKVWDFLSLSPTVQQYSLAYNTYLTQTKAMQGGGDEEGTFNGGGMTNRTANTHNTYPTHPLPDADAFISPQSLAKLYPPCVRYVLSLAASISGYSAVFQDFVTPIPAVGSFNLFSKTSYDVNYWSEQLNTVRGYQVPRVIVGCSDGRIRVFDQGRFMGFVVVAGKTDTGNTQDFSPHDGVVNSVVIDDRSKYLISGDSFGEILAWRLDNKGWYQLLRKFKRDTGPSSNAMNDVFDSGSVMSLSMHPEKLKGLMLVLSRQPALLRVLNMSTYKPLSYCEGYNGISSHIVREGEDAFSTGVFHRATFSADGKYIICCSNDSQNKQLFRISIWETFTGHQVPSPISSKLLSSPYLVF